MNSVISCRCDTAAQLQPANVSGDAITFLCRAFGWRPSFKRRTADSAFFFSNRLNLCLFYISINMQWGSVFSHLWFLHFQCHKHSWVDRNGKKEPIWGGKLSVHVKIKATEQKKKQCTATIVTRTTVVHVSKIVHFCIFAVAKTKSNYDYWVKYYQASLQMLLPKMV